MTHTSDADSNADQAEFWNAEPGQNWVTHQVDLDALFANVADLLLAACAPRAGERVVDIGCGAGALSFALAAAIAPSGHVHAVDISVPLVRRAEARKAELAIGNATFEVADAQTHPFEPRSFDLAASRFGLMFFSDPVAAFRNIASGLRAGGRIVFAAWAGPEHNPWFAWPQRIAIARVGAVEPTPPDAPGPLAFRDIERVRTILAEAGFSTPRGDRVAVDLLIPGGVETAARLAQIGPAARILRDRNGTAEDVAAIAEKIAEEFEQFGGADGIRIPACINLIRAERA